MRFKTQRFSDFKIVDTIRSERPAATKSTARFYNGYFAAGYLATVKVSTTWLGILTTSKIVEIYKVRMSDIWGYLDTETRIQGMSFFYLVTKYFAEHPE